MRGTRVIGWAVAVLLAAPIAAQPRDHGGMQFRLGAFWPAGGGSFFDENEQVFDFDPSDLDGVAIGGTYLAPLSNFWEFGFSMDYTEGSTFTRYQEFPSIGHEATLERLPVTVELRVLPGGRYGPAGQYWRPVPYLGIGAGMNFWRYEEAGDFIDFTNDEVFFDVFEDQGVALETHALAGIEMPIAPGWSLLVEGRYAWTDDELADDFDGLGKIDMGGASGYFGAAFRF